MNFKSFIYTVLFYYAINAKIIRIKENKIQSIEWGTSIPWPAESRCVTFNGYSIRIIPVSHDKYYIYPFYHPENHTYLPFITLDHMWKTKSSSQNDCHPKVINLYNESILQMRRTTNKSFNMVFLDEEKLANGFILISKLGIFSPSDQAYSLLNSSEIKYWNGTVMEFTERLFANLKKGDFKCYYIKKLHSINNIIVLCFIAMIISLGIMICMFLIINLVN